MSSSGTTALFLVAHPSNSCMHTSSDDRNVKPPALLIVRGSPCSPSPSPSRCLVLDALPDHVRAHAARGEPARIVGRALRVVALHEGHHPRLGLPLARRALLLQLLAQPGLGHRQHHVARPALVKAAKGLVGAWGAEDTVTGECYTVVDTLVASTNACGSQVRSDM